MSSAFTMSANFALVEKDIANAIKTEMQLYASSCNPGWLLQTAHDNLMSISAISVEAERAFSAAGIIIDKRFPRVLLKLIS